MTAKPTSLPQCTVPCNACVREVFLLFVDVAWVSRDRSKKEYLIELIPVLTQHDSRGHFSMLWLMYKDMRRWWNQKLIHKENEWPVISSQYSTIQKTRVKRSENFGASDTANGTVSPGKNFCSALIWTDWSVMSTLYILVRQLLVCNVYTLHSCSAIGLYRHEL